MSTFIPWLAINEYKASYDGDTYAHKFGNHVISGVSKKFPSIRLSRDFVESK